MTYSHSTYAVIVYPEFKHFLLELILRHPLSHRTRTAHTTRHHLQHIIHVIGAAPLLVRHHVDLFIHFWFLDQFTVRTHSLLPERLGELVRHQSGLVETCECNKLPAVAKLGETLDVSFLIGGFHGGLPVKRWRKIVCQPRTHTTSATPTSIVTNPGMEEQRFEEKHVLLLRPHSVHTLCKLLGLREIGQLTLHPDQITVRRVSNRAIHSTLTATLVPVKAFSRPRRIPIKVDVHTRDALCNRTRLRITLPLTLSHKLLDQPLLINMHASMNGIHDSLMEELQPSLGGPLILDRLQVIAGLATRLSRQHEIVQRLQGRVRTAQDEGVVARVDGRRDQRRRFRVSARHGQQVRAQHVGLRPDRDQPVDVLADGHQHLARHVPAFLGAGGLVFDVDAGRALFDEELGELHDGGEAAVARVCVGDDGSEVVGIGEAGALVFGRGEALFALFAVVEELGEPEVLDLVGDGGLPACQCLLRR